MRTNVFQEFFEQEKVRRQQLQLLTKPFSQLVSESIGRTLIAPAELDWLRTLNNQFAGYRAMAEALKAAATVHREWAASAFAGFASVQAVGGVVVGEATEATELEATTADREVCLAGSLAVVAADETALEIETRIVEVVGSIEDLLARHLPRIGTGLSAKWRGAHEALTCGNPDRAAQVSMSLRELIKGMIAGWLRRRARLRRRGWRRTQPSRRRGNACRRSFSPRMRPARCGRRILFTAKCWRANPRTSGCDGYRFSRMSFRSAWLC